jgi:GTP cyclohydrolase II
MTVLHHQQFNDSDSDLLDILTGPDPKVTFVRRHAALDPLLIAAATASGPHITHNHYHHDFFPGVRLPQGCLPKYTTEDTTSRNTSKRLAYVSRQAPRRQRLEEGKENDHPLHIDHPLKPADNLLFGAKKRRTSLVNSEVKYKPQKSQVISESVPSPIQVSTPPLEVQCMARTRIPTPHGPAFLHLYHNTRDSKEHLAIVIDPAQLSEPSNYQLTAPSIRSQSLDAIWTENETEMDRIVRGAYDGRLSSTSQHASNPLIQSPTMDLLEAIIPPPLIRIHSECFTGETVGSMRCDCGEQLDEAIRQIFQPITVSSRPPTTIPGRGAIIYLRQEGRGIGLLSKIRAYNLQDMGHDTVTANLMLGYKADERGYELAAAILRDLSLGSGTSSSKQEGVRVLTNNPDKVEALEKEGIRVVERVSMIPRSWSMNTDTDGLHAKVAGATLIGGNVAYGEDLDKYLRTKILRMGHILPLDII